MKVRINEQHDYITVTAEPKPKFRVTMTWGRWGEKFKASAPGTMTQEEFNAVIPKGTANRILQLMSCKVDNPGNLSKKFVEAFGKAPTVLEALALIETKG